MEVSKCWKIVEFPKIPIKMKNCKTFHEVQTASRLKEIIQSLPNLTCPPPKKNIKSYYVSGTETFLRRYTEIFRQIQRYTDISLQSQEMVQCKCFFWHQTKKVCWKISKVRRVFGFVAGAYYFQCQVSWGS